MKKKIIIVVSIIIIFLVGIIGYMVVKDINEENKLKDELNYINELVNEENIDTEKINTVLNRTVTNDDYKVVETSYKEYLKDSFDCMVKITDTINDERLINILTADNYKNDGPEFTSSKKYLEEAKQTLIENKDKYYDYLTEEKAMSYIEDKNLDEYYINLYKEELVGNIEEEKNDKTVENSINDIINIIDTSQEILTFLNENKNSWEIEDNQIVFDTTDLNNKYNELINKL